MVQEPPHRLGFDTLRGVKVVTKPLSRAPSATEAPFLCWLVIPLLAVAGGRSFAQLSGTTASVSPASVGFASAVTGTASEPRTVTLRNTGGSTLRVSTITVMGAHAADFTADNSCGLPVAPGGSCAITVSFRPSAVGARTGSIVIKGNIADRTVGLTGSGTAPPQPAIALTPPSAGFSSVIVGSTSAAQTLMLRNTGKGTLRISSITLTGTHPADFAANNTCGAPVAPDATCTLSVSFRPSVLGARAASIVIKSNIADRTVGLSGTGVVPPPPVLSVSPSRIAFPGTVVGETAEAQAVTLRNTGRGTLQIATITVNGGNARDFAAGNSCGSPVAPGASCAISVSFRPSAIGSRSAVIEIKGNIPTVGVAVSGIGAVPETISISGTLSVNGGLLIDADTNDPRQPAIGGNDTCSLSQSAVAPAVIGGYVTQLATGRAGDRFAAATDKFDVYRTKLTAGATIELLTAGFNPDAASTNVLHLGLLSADCLTYLQSAPEDLGVKSMLVRQTGEYFVVVQAAKGGSNYLLRLLPPPAGVSSTKQDDTSGVPDFIDGQVVLSKGGQSGLRQVLGGGIGSGGLFPRPSTKTFSPSAIAGTTAAVGDADGFRRTLGAYLGERSVSVGEIRDYGAIASVKVDRRAAVAAIRAQDAGTGWSRASEALTGEGRAKDTRSIQEALGARFVSEKLQRYIELHEIAQDLALETGARRGELNLIRTTESVGDPQAYLQRWHYDAIQLGQALGLYAASPKSDVLVAVIDSGVFLGHPDLADRLAPGYDFIEEPAVAIDGDGLDSDPDDPGYLDAAGNPGYHGTHVAGTVAAAADNGIGVAGVAGSGGRVKVMPLRVCGQGGCPSVSIANAIRFAAGETVAGVRAARKADIINLSLGGVGACPQVFQDAITAARAAGVIVFAAAGNGYQQGNPALTPANCEGVIAVAATGPDGSRAFYSTVQPYVDIAAPGGDSSRIQFPQSQVHSTWAIGSRRGIEDTRSPAYRSLQGTSMATPHAAGVAALMRSVWSAMTPADFDSALTLGKLTSSAGGASGKTQAFGYGLVDAAKSVAYALDKARTGGGGAYLSADPAVLDFGTSGSTQALTVRKVGAAAVRDISPLVFARWLTIARTASSALEDTYTLSVDRTGLAAGAYSVVVRITDTLGATTDVTVSMVVASPVATSSSGTAVYVLVWDFTQRRTVAFVELDPSTLAARPFRLAPARSSNTYLLVAGSDADNDGVICEVGELCSAWPISDKLSAISSSRPTADVALSVGFENRSVATVKNASVGGIWVGDLSGSRVLMLTAESGDLRALPLDNGPLDSMIWGRASAVGRDIRIEYTAADADAVSGSGVVQGVIEERRRIAGDHVFTDASGNVVSRQQIEFAFDGLYNNPSALSLVTGRWINAGGGYSFAIDANGKLSFSDGQSGCKGSGQISVIDPAYNMYDLRLSLGGCDASYASFNGAQVDGLATLAPGTAAAKPAFYVVGQGRLGIKIYPVLLIAEPAD